MLTISGTLIGLLVGDEDTLSTTVGASDRVFVGAIKGKMDGDLVNWITHWRI